MSFCNRLLFRSCFHASMARLAFIHMFIVASSLGNQCQTSRCAYDMNRASSTGIIEALGLADIPELRQAKGTTVVLYNGQVMG